MGLFSKKPALDSLPPAEWLSESERRFDAAKGPHFGTPDTMANGGVQKHAKGEVGTALFFFAKSIDMLQTQYVYLEMKHRRPSSDDIYIIDWFVTSLLDSLEAHPGVPVHSMAQEPRNFLDQICWLAPTAGYTGEPYGQGRDRIDLLLRAHPPA